MSISLEWTRKQDNVDRVLALYRDPRLLTLQAIADEMGSTFHNVQHVVKTHMPLPERKAHGSLRKSASKVGLKNPMKGKVREAHHNWQGEVADGYGYLTILFGGKRQFVHRVAMMQALGLLQLPKQWAVHHIDGDPLNNQLDNLALVTHAGHKRLHYMQSKDTLAISLKKSTMAEVLRSMTFPSKRTKATRR